MEQKLLRFIEWAEPHGLAGFNDVHSEHYRREDPWFDWSARFTNGSIARTPFVRWNFVGQDCRPLSRERQQAKPVVLRPDALIAEGWYLSFAKAYTNVLVHHKNVTTPSTVTQMALSAFEEALRRTNLLAKPSLEAIDARTFEVAVQIVREFPLKSATLYEIGKELEILAGLLQGGYHSKQLRMDGAGFGLVARPFIFKSSIVQSRDKRNQLFERAGEQNTRLSTETIVFVGKAYRMCLANYGPSHIVTAMASMVAIPLTTTSMRMSDFLNLRYDAINFDKDTERVKIRIYRPKIKRYQALPIPRKLNTLSQELFAKGVAFGASARSVFTYYIDKFGGDFDAINEIYIPPEFIPFFTKEYFVRRDLQDDPKPILFDEEDEVSYPQYLGNLYRLKRYRGMVQHGDIVKCKGEKGLCAPIKSVEALLESLEIEPPKAIKVACSTLFVNDYWLFRQKSLRGISNPTRQVIKEHFVLHGRPSHILGSTKELKFLLLTSFKATRPPHWPYTNSDRNLRLDEAFAVMFSVAGARRCDRDEMSVCWWKPVLMPATFIHAWVHPTLGKPPALFALLDLKKEDGTYPSFTFQDTRKLFQTTALIAGAEVAVLDELSGRTSGPQSAHYDQRTPREIAMGSIELFDPEEEATVVGPVMEAARVVPIVDRSAFLYQNSFPKQLTEVGGCSTSWSVNPCDKHGACMACEHSVWRKGDHARLPRIRYLHAQAERMIAEGQRLIAAGSFAGPIERHIRQHEAVRDRCAAIFAVEADPTIPVGALVTFSASPASLGAAELASRLHNRGIKRGETYGNAENK